MQSNTGTTRVALSIREYGGGEDFVRGQFRAGTILCGENFVAPPNLVQGNETREFRHTQPLVPCGQPFV